MYKTGNWIYCNNQGVFFLPYISPKTFSKEFNAMFERGCITKKRALDELLSLKVIIEGGIESGSSFFQSNGNGMLIEANPKIYLFEIAGLLMNKYDPSPINRRGYSVLRDRILEDSIKLSLPKVLN